MINGINLSEEYDYVENLIKVHGLDDTHIGKGTQLFLMQLKNWV